jgi:hypothetical protein
MKLDWLIMAEGIGQDAAGVLTLIGINQNVLVTSALPAVTKRALVAHVLDDGSTLSEGAVLTAVFSATSPSGDVLASLEGKATVGRRRLSDHPVTLDLPAEVPLQITEYGTYMLGVRVSAANESVTGELALHVVQRLSPEVTSQVSAGPDPSDA